MGALSTVHESAERRCRECEQLRDELDETRERLRQIVDALRDEAAPVVPGLTAHQTLFLGALLKRRQLPRDAALDLLYAATDVREARQPKVLDVMVHHLRRKLKPYGVNIETVWGWGHRIDAASVAALGAIEASPRVTEERAPC